MTFNHIADIRKYIDDLHNVNHGYQQFDFWKSTIQLWISAIGTHYANCGCPQCDLRISKIRIVISTIQLLITTNRIMRSQQNVDKTDNCGCGISRRCRLSECRHTEGQGTKQDWRVRSAIISVYPSNTVCVR